MLLRCFPLYTVFLLSLSPSYRCSLYSWKGQSSAAHAWLRWVMQLNKNSHWFLSFLPWCTKVNTLGSDDLIESVCFVRGIDVSPYSYSTLFQKISLHIIMQYACMLTISLTDWEKLDSPMVIAQVTKKSVQDITPSVVLLANVSFKRTDLLDDPLISQLIWALNQGSHTLTERVYDLNVP